MVEVQLLQMDGGRPIARHRVRGDKFLLGRHKSCQLKIDSTAVSTTHCVIMRHQDQLLITDLGSRSGTSVNETVLTLAETAPLQHGDRIKLADSEFVLSVRDAETNQPVYCHPLYADSVQYPIVSVANRRRDDRDAGGPRGSEESNEKQTTPVISASNATDADDTTTFETDASDALEDTCVEKDHRVDAAEDTDEPAHVANAKAEHARKIAAVREKLMHCEDSSSAATDALRKMFRDSGSKKG